MTFKNLNDETITTKNPVALSRISWDGSPRYIAQADGVEHAIGEAVWYSLQEHYLNDRFVERNRSSD